MVVGGGLGCSEASDAMLVGVGEVVDDDEGSENEGLAATRASNSVVITMDEDEVGMVPVASATLVGGG